MAKRPAAECIVVFGTQPLKPFIKGKGSGISEFEGEWLEIPALAKTPLFVMRHPQDLADAAEDIRRQELLFRHMREHASFWTHEFWELRKPAAWMSASSCI